MLIFQGDPWVRARDARETDLMLAVEGSIRGVFLRVSLPSRAIYKPVLRLLLHRAGRSVTLRMPWSEGGTAFGDTISCSCAGSLLTSGTDITLREIATEIAFWELLQICCVAGSSVTFITKSSNKGLISV